MLNLPKASSRLWPRRVGIAVVEAGWLTAVFLVPLAVNPWGFNYSLPKVAIFRGLTLLMAAGHVLALAWSPGRPDARRWLRRPLVRPILLAAGAILVSTVLSISSLVSLWGSYHRHQGAYLLLCLIAWALLIAAHLRTEAQRRRLSTVVIVAGSLVALTPFVESLRWDENPLAWRPGGSLGNPIFLGAYLIGVIPFTLARLIADGREFAPRQSGRSTPSASRLLSLAPRLGWGAALALQLFALLITQSRGPWVGALVGIAVLAVLILRPVRRRLVLVGLVFASLLTGALAAGLSFGLAPAERASQLPYVRRAVRATDLTGGTVRVRLVLWRAAAEVLTEWPQVGLVSDRMHGLRPLVGYGPDTASIVYTAAYPPELAHIEDPSAIWDRAHNETLDLLTMRGILGLVATAAVGVACARRGLALWRVARTSGQRAWVAAPVAALAAHAVEVQFAFTVTATAMMSWLCVAWLAADWSSGVSEGSGVVGQERPRGCESRVRRRASSRAASRARWRIYAAVGAAVLVLWTVRVEGGAIRGDTLVARARALDRAGSWEKSVELYDRALAVIPWQATWHQFRAEAFYNLAHALPDDERTLRPQLLEAAGRSLERARRLEPLELEHYSNSGILHAYWSDTLDPAHLQTAVAFFQQAFRLAPTRARLPASLGHVYHNHERYRDALEQYRAALQIDPQFASAHYDSGLAWQALDRLNQARQAFQAALDLAPECEACQEALHRLEE